MSYAVYVYPVTEEDMLELSSRASQTRAMEKAIFAIVSLGPFPYVSGGAIPNPKRIYQLISDQHGTYYWHAFLATNTHFGSCAGDTICQCLHRLSVKDPSHLVHKVVYIEYTYEESLYVPLIREFPGILEAVVRNWLDVPIISPLLLAGKGTDFSDTVRVRRIRSRKH